jgi:hypothetical protein
VGVDVAGCGLDVTLLGFRARFVDMNPITIKPTTRMTMTMAQVRKPLRAVLRFGSSSRRFT